MHRNSRYFNKNEGKHNHFGQWDENDNKNLKSASEPKKTQNHHLKTKENSKDFKS
jgi:hypothetical protein